MEWLAQVDLIERARALDGSWKIKSDTRRRSSKTERMSVRNYDGCFTLAAKSNFFDLLVAIQQPHFRKPLYPQ